MLRSQGLLPVAFSDLCENTDLVSDELMTKFGHIVRQCLWVGDTAWRIAVDTGVLMLSQLYCNVHELEVPYTMGSSIGLGLYLHIVYANHNCRPNAHVVLGSDGAMTLRSLRAIAADEEVHIAYVDQLSNVSVRRSLLQSGFCFTCQCAACTVEQELEVLPMQSSLINCCEFMN